VFGAVTAAGLNMGAITADGFLSRKTKGRDTFGAITAAAGFLSRETQRRENAFVAVTAETERKDASHVLNSPSSLAYQLSALPTPQREAYFTVFMSNKKCESALTKIFEPCPLVFITPTPTVQQTPTLSHPFHHYTPSKYGGRHQFIGKNFYSFNLQRASDAAAYYEQDKIIKLYHTTGNPEQRKHTLNLFLSEKTIIADTKSIIGEVILDKEAVAGMQLLILRSMKKILKKIFQCSKGRIANNQRSYVNVCASLIYNKESRDRKRDVGSYT
jgi:hypothetical protein